MVDSGRVCHRWTVEATALTGLGVTASVLVASTGLGLWRRHRDGRMRPVAPATPATAGEGELVEDGLLAGLGVEAGTPVTLLQFSSAFCAPCRATRRVCDEVATMLDGVRHVEVDAEAHLDAVRALNIWRTPTVLVVDTAGRVVQRASGQPSKAQVIAAVAPLLDDVVVPS
jgi:thiol-disulfide isomerase/thioredoxin